MTVDNALACPDVLDAEAAKAILSEIIASSDPGSAFDAMSILREHPELEEHRSVVLDLAYEEFCRRRDAGEREAPSEFVKRFPGFEESLLRTLQVHDYLDGNLEALLGKSTTNWPEANNDLANFKLIREIGRGGFSRVFLAKDSELGDRNVVVKLCNMPNDEAARLGQLAHPNIVPVHSVQTDHEFELTVICMPYLGTTTLGHVLADMFKTGRPQKGREVLKFLEQRSDPSAKPIYPETPQPSRILREGSYSDAIVELGSKLCDGLAHAHGQGICHCDIKPSNVLITSGGQPLLFDFNLSLQRGEAKSVGGTLPYMAPEQLMCLVQNRDPKLAIDHRTDIFSFGVTMVQLLTGKLPFCGDEFKSGMKDGPALLLENQLAGFDQLEDLCEIVGARLARVIADCLAFDPEQRPRSAEFVADQFSRHLSRGARTMRWLQKHRAAVTIAVVALLLTGVSLGIVQANRPSFAELEYAQGIELLDKGNFNEAKEHLTQVIKISGERPAATMARGWANLSLASLDVDLDESQRDALLIAARDDLTIVWEETGCAEAAASLGQCFTQMGRYEEAAIFFERSINSGMVSPSVLNDLGYCYNKMKKLELADDYLRQAIEAEPTLQAAHHNRANVRWRLAQQEELLGKKAQLEGDAELEKRHTMRAIDHVQAAIQHIVAARQVGTSNAELELAAARIYGFAYALYSNYSGATADRNARSSNYFEELLNSCQTALSMHLPPARLREFAIVIPELKNNTEFQTLLNATPSSQKARRDELFLNIYPDVKGYLRTFE